MGLAYLAHRQATGYPAADIALKSTPISLAPPPEQAHALLVRLVLSCAELCRAVPPGEARAQLSCAESKCSPGEARAQSC